jgi:quercetin dioxygenase-like cupin family protein
MKFRKLFISAILMFILSCSSKITHPDSLAINLADVEWGEPKDGSIAPIGIRIALQSTDPNTGGISYYTWFPAGSFFDLHWHTYDEYAVVVRGAVTISLGDKVYDLEPGAFIVIPGGMHHSWDVPDSTDAIILAKRSGPADFHFVNR